MLRLTLILFLVVGYAQDCIDGVEVELWGECYNIEETTELSFIGDTWVAPEDLLEKSPRDWKSDEFN